MLVVEADPRGGSLAAWLDIPVAPSLSAVVTRATPGEWAVIDRLSRLTPSGLRVIPAPVRAVEATPRCRRGGRRDLPEARATRLARCAGRRRTGRRSRRSAGRRHPVDARGRRAPPSATVGRAAAFGSNGWRSVFAQLTARAVEAVLAVIGQRTVRRRRDRRLRRGGAIATPPVFALADDPLAAAVLAGRSGVSRRRLLRLPLLRSSAALAAFLSNRLTEVAAIDRWRVER